MAPREICIGLLGLGTVGSGVAEVLLTKKDDVEREIGLPVRLQRILVRDIEARRGFAVDRALLTTDPQTILADPEINMMIEVMGGVQPAADYIRQALQNGKH